MRSKNERRWQKMSKYTFELREMIDTFGRDEVKGWFMDYDLSDYLTPEEIGVIETRGVWSKDKLADRILEHFYLREVGQDAPGAFIHFAKDTMHELMETYAPLIYSASIKYDPLVNVNYSEIFDRNTTNSGSTNTNRDINGSGLKIHSDTPQGEINKSNILQGKFASDTDANENSENEQGNTTSNDSGNEHYTRQTIGNSGVSATSQAMIQQYRDIIRALNTEIVYQLEPLFMGIY